MDDQKLDDLLSRAASVKDNDIAESTSDTLLHELCEEIMSTTTDQHKAPDIPALVTNNGAPKHRKPKRWPRFAAAAAAAAAVATGIGANIDLPGVDDGGTAWASELVQFAQRSPLILMDDPAWKVTYADEHGDDGELDFTNGSRSVSLHWRPGPLADWLDDRLDGGTDHGPHRVINGTATVVQDGSSDSFTALWTADGRVVEFRNDNSNLEEFKGLLDTLAVVDVDTWLAAMPASVIETADQPAVIDEMLTGIPVPDGFDRGALADDANIKDRYQLGARVVGAVSCAWTEQWIDATEAGDDSSAQQAADAMNTSSEWPILQEMNVSGDYGQVVAEIADAMSTDGMLLDNVPIADEYQAELGCGQ